LANDELRQQFIDPTAVELDEGAITQRGLGSTRHIALDVSGLDTPYQTADNLHVLPENSTQDVDRLLAWWDMDGSRVFNLIPTGPGTHKAYFPTPVSVRDALTRYVDLGGKVDRTMINHFAHWAADEGEKARMLRLSSSDGKAEYKSWAHDSQRSVLEMFEAFPSVRPPLEYVFRLVPRITPRAYTICSSAVTHPREAHIVVSILNSKKPGSEGAARWMRGVCSNHVARATVGSTLRVYLRPSTFKLPSDSARPVIMVGPGTGIAPMRAFMYERRQQAARGEPVGPTALFFGCRRSDTDFVYKEEVMQFSNDGTLSMCELAFSREGAEKVYVQHKLAEKGAQVWEWLQGGGHFYVCGATSMGRDVRACVEGIISGHGGKSAREAREYVEQMIANDHRYVEELWS
jgi:NADPH-ferrihemoprotein reductase